MIREATEEEREQIVSALAKCYKLEDQTDESFTVIEEAVKNATIAVETDYATEQPSYGGKLVMIVFDLSPCAHFTLIEDKGLLVPQPADAEVLTEIGVL